MLLAGDIGGTKTNLAIYSPQAGPFAPLAEETYSSANYHSLEELVYDFLSQVNLQIEQASFGVAGPVAGDQATITNLPWVIDGQKLQSVLKISSVHLLNDLAAIAHAIPFLMPDDVHTLNTGHPIPQGPMAVIAPGTGLGEAYLTWDGAKYQAHASEGGHADFAPTTPLEVELLCFLQKRFGHVSFERVCSGKGIPNIYSFLKESGYAEEPDWLSEQLASTDDPTPVIFNAALKPDKSCRLCLVTLETFVSTLGAEAGNLALKIGATGGLYLGGGSPPRIVPLLENEVFLSPFRKKGRLSLLLDQIPVYIILNPKVALLGAACHGLEIGAGEKISLPKKQVSK